MGDPKEIKQLGKNRKAFFEYEVLENLEAGIVLAGSEVKSIRMAHFNFNDAWAEISRGELWLVGFHITPYSHGSIFNHESDRKRKLLLKSVQIEKWRRRTEEKGFTIVPLNVHLKGGLIKIELGLCRGKKLHDKRDSIREKDLNRDAEREMRNR